jgi:hypothetical protein
MQVVAPYKQYFMHFIPLTNILDPDDAAIAEHLLSILASSYTMFGGLNGTVGGCGAVQKNARKYGKDRTWEIAAQSLIKQDLFQRNADKIEKEVDATAFLFQYKDKGSESTELETIHERIQRADHDIETANECLRQKGRKPFPAAGFYA